MFLKYKLARALVVTVFVAFHGCALKSDHPTAPALPEGKVRVLFIGNSLTYTNNLPSLFLALARLAGDTDVVAQSIAYPDFALEDHWAQGTARRSLEQNKYEFVVMQQGSSALPESQVNLKYWSQQFAPLITAAGATPVMFMVWPTVGRSFDFPNVKDSYRNAAAAINGIFAPAGDAWVATFEANAGARLYDADGLHPSIAGTYLSALVLLERVRGIQPEQLPPVIPSVPFAEADVIKLQQAARVALDRNPARP